VDGEFQGNHGTRGRGHARRILVFKNYRIVGELDYSSLKAWAMASFSFVLSLSCQY